MKRKGVPMLACSPAVAPSTLRYGGCPGLDRSRMLTAAKKIFNPVSDINQFYHLWSGETRLIRRHHSYLFGPFFGRLYLFDVPFKQRIHFLFYKIMT